MKHSILDIKGLKVGHAQNESAKTGVTVVLAEDGAICGVDVRGSAPGTRETDLLNPVNMIQEVHGIILSGGSAFGLASAEGVMQYLEEKGVGFDVGVTHVPIVSGAVLFDLAYGDFAVRPDKDMGYLACQNATDQTLKEGSVGAGCGAMVGKLHGLKSACKGGIGSYSLWNEDKTICVSALIAVNAFGDIYDKETIIAGAKDENGNFINTEEYIASLNPSLGFQGQNTTIGIIATNVKLDKAQATKLASMAQNGLARSIRPVHTTRDGDTLFCLSTKEVSCEVVPLDYLGILAIKATEQAVLRAVRFA